MRLLIVFSSILVLSSIAIAKTIYVPGDFSTIQKAIDAAAKGDTVLVAPLVYWEIIDFKGKAITVKSSDGPDNTVIAGNYNGSVVTFKSKEDFDSKLEGFSIVYGSGTYDPSWGFLGGGIYCINSSPTITNNIIRDNYAGYGGGIEVAYGSSPLISSNIISNNIATYPSNISGGGGISIYYNSSPIIEDNIITANYVTGDGSGGGILISYGSSPTIEKNTISNNFTVGKGYGGGIAVVFNCKGEISGNSILENTTKANGGGITLAQDSHFIISNNIISNNSSEYNGGAIGCYEHSSGLLTNNIIFENSCNYGDGGGIDVWNDSNMIMTNNIIYYNLSLNMNGGGINCEGSSITIVNTIFWDNDAKAGPELYIEDYNKPSNVNISYSDVKGGQGSVHVVPGSTLYWGPGMIDTDPLFVDPVNGDFHLTFHSSCKDSGDNTVTGIPEEDFEGDPRIAYGNVDMGADEFFTHFYWTGDAIPGGVVTLKFVGIPHSSPVRLWLGSGLLNPPWPTPYGNWYLEFPLLAEFSILGSIPNPEGVLALPFNIPTNMPTPLSLPLQAGISMELTNFNYMNIK